MDWAHFTHLLSHFHSLLHTHTMFSSNSNEITHHGVLRSHERSHKHVASGRGHDCRRFFVNTRVKASSMIRQLWSWSGSFQAVTRLLWRRLHVPSSYFRWRYRMRMILFLSIMHKLSETSPYFLWDVWCNWSCWLNCVAKVYRCSTSISLWHDHRYCRWISEVRENNRSRVSRVLVFVHHWVFWEWVLTSSNCCWYLVFARQGWRAWIFQYVREHRLYALKVKQLFSRLVGPIYIVRYQTSYNHPWSCCFSWPLYLTCFLESLIPTTISMCSINLHYSLYHKMTHSRSVLHC
jgi:hypothetical protein